MFFDTWGWLAIAHRDDQRHEEVTALYRDFILAGGMPVTSDYILSESISLLRVRTTAKGTAHFIDGFLTGVRGGKIILERITEERWAVAWQLSKKFADKPDISFVDLASFALMKELRISETLTADRHFELIGMGFRKLF
jgi:predicted nucleic acid-binding protein